MDLAYRQIMRCHPLYSRFTAANAITEAELIHFLVGMAEGTARAKKTLAKVLPLGVSVEVEGLEPDLAEALKKHGLRLLPHTFQVELV